MNCVQRLIASNRTKIATSKLQLRYNWRSMKDMCIPSISPLHTHANANTRVGDEEKDMKRNSFTAPITQTALFSFSHTGQATFFPASMKYQCIESIVTRRYKSTLSDIDKTEEAVKKGLEKFSASTKKSSDSSEDPSRSNTDKAKATARKGALSIRETINKYGLTFIGTYLGVYVTTLGTLFVAVDNGYLDPITITSIDLPWHSGAEEISADKKDFESAVDFISMYMKRFPWTEKYADVVSNNPRMTNLALAWIAVKFTEPLRLAASIGILRKITKDK